MKETTVDEMQESSRLSDIVAKGFELLIKEGDTREIGKFLAYPAENVIAPNWLKKVCGIDTVKAPDDSEGQQEKYDRLTMNGKKLQVKYRGGKELHMEQTRRTTGKNEHNGAKNGQVRYTINDFDVVLIIIPDNNFTSIDYWEYLAIPISELEDPKMPGYCVGRVPAHIKKKYTGVAKEVLIKMENT